MGDGSGNRSAGRLLGIDHVGVLVEDLSAAIDHFTGLGLDFVSKEEISDVGVRLAYLGSGGQLLQLIQPVKPGPLTQHLEQHGEGLHHVCFAVSAIDALVSRLPGEENPTVNRGGRDMRTCFLRNPHHGVVVELAESGLTKELRD